MPVRRLDDPPASADVVIVGAGIVGAATALFAARAGLRPVVVERRPAIATLTTAASTGAYRLQFDNEQEWRMVSESVAVFENFEEVTGQDDYRARLRPRGYLWVTTSEDRARQQRALVDRQRSWGQRDIDILDAADIRAAFPHVTPDAVQARWRARDGFVDPVQLALGFLAGSAAPVVTACEVVSISVRAHAVAGVVTARGVISAPAVVVAAGPFSGVVAGGAGVGLPVSTVVRHKVVMPEVARVPPGAPMTIDDDTGAHWRPALAGAFLLFTDPATAPSAPADPVPPDPRQAFRLLDPASPVSVARVSPFWAEEWAHGGACWIVQSGQYTMTPDHRPLIGPAGPAGMFVNTGYSGHGIMGSPAGGRHLVDVMTGKVRPDANPFDPGREFTPRDLDLL